MTTQRRSDEYRAWAKEYRRTHKEQIRKKNAEWRRRNPERYLQHGKLYRQRHPEKVRQVNRAYYAKTKEKQREYGRVSHLRRKYGLSSKQVEVIWKNQNEVCALCLRPITGKKLVDHCHKTGKFRGLVHRKCNAILGMADDDLQILERAIVYLKDFAIRLEESRRIE